jgi:hypothetical protein
LVLNYKFLPKIYLSIPDLSCFGDGKMKKDIKKIYRQGDVVIVCNSEIPKDSEKLSHLELARGELTGHAHRITSGDAELYEKGCCGPRGQ